MKYLLDTNVICEATARQPDPGVAEWVDTHSRESLLSCVTLGEIWKGVHRLPEGKRKEGLAKWAESLEENFAEQILPLDTVTLKEWGKLCVRHEAKGFNLDVLDGLIAATAVVHQLIVVTRNTADFPPEVKTFNPWVN